MFGDEIGMFGQPALLQHVAQLLLAPAPARLGGIAQRIAQPRCFCTHLLLPFAHRLDQSAKLAKGIDAFLLQLADLRLIGGKALSDRLKQSAQPLGAGFLAFAEAVSRALEEGFLRAFEHFGPRSLKLLLQRLLRFEQQSLLLVEMDGIRLERRQFRRNSGELRCKIIGLLGSDARPGKFGNRPAEFLVEFARLAVADEKALAQIGQRTRAEKPAKRTARDKTGKKGYKGKKLGVQGVLSFWNEART